MLVWAGVNLFGLIGSRSASRWPLFMHAVWTSVLARVIEVSRDTFPAQNCFLSSARILLFRFLSFLLILSFCITIHYLHLIELPEGIRIGQLTFCEITSLLSVYIAHIQCCN